MAEVRSRVRCARAGVVMLRKGVATHTRARDTRMHRAGAAACSTKNEAAHAHGKVLTRSTSERSKRQCR